MNTNPNAIRILCYGDSKTWGANPNNNDRYASDERWTGRLQNLLGNDFEIIEEGLCGRSTIFERENRPGRNGKTYLLPCVISHSPIDIVILSLGTNDFKNEKINAEDVAKGNEELIRIIQENVWNKNGQVPKLILACVPGIDESNDYAREKGMIGVGKKIAKLPDEIKKLAEKYNYAFVNFQEIVKPSKKDGCHLELEAHKKIAEFLYEKIKSL